MAGKLVLTGMSTCDIPIAHIIHWMSTDGPWSLASNMETRDLMPKGAFLGHGRFKENGVKLIRKIFGTGPRNRIS